MKWYNRPNQIQGLIFDMDNTLYSNAEYTKHQEDVLINRLAIQRNESPTATLLAIDSWRSNYRYENDGRKPSLANTFLGFGISISTSISWREDLICPEKYLNPDYQLREIILELKQKYQLSVVTNNPVKTALKTFEVLGIADLIPVIIGLDTFGVSKPAPEAFSYAANQMGIVAEQILSIGDRYEIDLEPAIKLGMGGLLIESINEIYSLCQIL